MERKEDTTALVDLGDARILTRGAAPVGLEDTNGIGYQLDPGLSADD